MKNIFKNIKEKINNKGAELTAKAHCAVENVKGEFYIDKTVGIIIAVVVGALLLGLVYTFVNTNIGTKLTTEINKLWSYSGS